MTRMDLTETLATLGLAVPSIYLVLVALGRWLKRRAAVPLGILYQIFSLALAFFLPLCFLDTLTWIRQLLGSLVAILGTIVGLALVRRFLWDYYFRDLRQTTVPKY